MKEIRIRGLIPRYQTESIYHIVDECNDLESELLMFPKGTHDDCADAAAYQVQIADRPDDILKVLQQEYEDEREVAEAGDRFAL
jgi:phage terminase large subunit-like protein